jgi:uncharacterized protein DUF6804
MYLKVMISISLAALTVALFLTGNPGYRVILQFLISTSAVLIVVHAVRAEAEYLWAGVFCGVALLFNPIVPVVMPGRGFFLLDLVCVAVFLLYYRVHKAKPRMSIASITRNGPGARAL